MTRPLTSPELVHLRKAGQRSRLFLAGLENPPIIFQARVNQVFTTHDMQAYIDFDTVTTGAFGDIIPGMTVLIGSAAGLSDKGICRARKAATSTRLFIGEQSEIDLQDDLYITVVDEMSLWVKRTNSLGGGVLKMDNDIAYSDQHENFDPVPVMGPDVVLDVDAYPVTVQFPEAADSWVIGSSISAILWTATAGVFTDETTIDPTLTISSYPTGGRIRVALQLTAGNGKIFTAYRYIYIYDATHLAVDDFNLGSCSGDYDTGNWSFDITMLADATLDVLRDRAPIILFARDYYGSTKISIGACEGRENIVARGWIDGESIDWDKRNGQVTFTVQGPAFWMERQDADALTLTMALNTPAVWTVMPALTPRLALFHLLHWRSTATAILDCRLTEDDRMSPGYNVAAQNMLQQIRDIASLSIYADPGCNEYGQIFIDVEPQLVPEADRDFPIVMEITKDDIQDPADINRRTSALVGLVAQSGVVATAGGSSGALFSLSPGHIPGRFGSPEIPEKLLLVDQTQANELCGLVRGWRNNMYDAINLDLASNNRMISTYPRQYCEIDIAAEDTVRGIAYAGRIIPRYVSREWDADAKYLHTSVTFEAETFADLAINGDVPEIVGFDLSAPPKFDFPKMPDFVIPYLDPTDVPNNHPKKVAICTAEGIFYTENFDADPADVVWQSMNNGLDANDRTQIARFEVTPGGILYILTNGSVATGFGKVMRASGLGASWVTVFTPTDRIYEGSVRTVRLCGLGVNDYAYDEIAIVDSVQFITFGSNDAGNFYVGSGGSFGSGEPFANVDYDILTAVEFEANKWFVSTRRPAGIGGSAPRPYLFRFDSGGGFEDEFDLTTGAGQGGSRQHSDHGSGQIYLWTNGGNRPGYTVAQPDGTFVDEQGTADDFDPENDQSLAFSPSGTHAMGGGVDGPTLHYDAFATTDSGATWTDMGGTIPIGSDVWENCRDNYRWIFGGGIIIRLTMDQGATYIDKMGNLLYIAPLVDITHMRFIS